MSINIDNLDFNLPNSLGVCTQINFQNNYGVYLIKINNLYTLYIMKKLSENLWGTEMDNNMSQILVENGIEGLTKVEAENYITQVQNIVI